MANWLSADSRKLRVRLIVLVGWTLLAAMQIVFWQMTHPSAQRDVVVGVRAAILIRALAWIAFTPIIVHLARRFDLRTRPRLPKAAVHFAAAVIMAAIEAAAYGAAWAYFGTELVDLPFRGYFGTFLNGSLYLYLIVIAIVYGTEWHARQNAESLHEDKLKSALTTAQLHSLTLQLHPHFLFNSLNAVAELVHREADTAARMLLHLRELLRESLDLAPEGVVSLRRELAFLHHYVELQRIRFSALEFKKEVDAAALDCLVPHFLLQPLVENSIRHGLTPRGGRGVISLSARLVDGQLQIEIADNGIGARDAPVRTGLGLRNVRERIAGFFPSGRFEFLSEPGAGATSRIVLPIVRPTSAPTEPPILADPGVKGAAPFHFALVLRTALAAAAMLFVVSLIKEFALFDLLGQTAGTARQWIAIDLFSSAVWVPAGVLVATAAYNAARRHHRAKWSTILIAVLVTFPAVSLVVRAKLGLVYSPEFQLMSPRAFYWMAQDVAIFAAIATVAGAFGIYRVWRDTEVSAARVYRQLSDFRVQVVRGRLQPLAVLNILGRLADLAKRDPDKTDYLIGRLGELLRAFLEHDQEGVITATEEISTLRVLLELEAGVGLRPSTQLVVIGDMETVTLEARSIVATLQQFELENNAQAESIRMAADAGELRIAVEDSAGATASFSIPAWRVGGHGLGELVPMGAA